jgi:hypothetical protein
MQAPNNMKTGELAAVSSEVTGPFGVTKKSDN